MRCFLEFVGRELSCPPRYDAIQRVPNPRYHTPIPNVIIPDICLPRQLNQNWKETSVEDSPVSPQAIR